MKRILSLCLAALLILPLPAAALAAEDTGTEATTEATEAAAEPASETSEVTEEASTEPTRPADACGENLTWSYKDGVLTVSGSGVMDDFTGSTPWEEYRDSITTVVFTGGVTYVGAYAFRDCNSLSAVDFGSAMHTIGERAFQSCEKLTSIHLPASFRRFASESFEGCTGLTEVYCAGGMPSFNFNCLWNYGTITVYCPTNNPWPASAVEELETNFGGRLQVLAADGKDIFDFGTDETEPVTQPATEPATEPTQAPTTQPTTEPTQAPTEAPTTEPEAEETEAQETVQETTAATEETETQPTTEAAEETESVDGDFLAGKSWIGIVIIAGVLTLLVAGALIVRASSRGGKYSA